MEHPVRTLRLVGWIEGVSFLLLLGVAMPLKYFWAMPSAVQIVGWLHGVLFIAFVVVLARAKRALAWSNRQAALPFAAALLPFGPFMIDKHLRRLQDAARP